MALFFGVGSRDDILALVKGFSGGCHPERRPQEELRQNGKMTDPHKLAVNLDSWFY
jgi:hypothetical protein